MRLDGPSAGTTGAMVRDMAAIFALVFVPALAAVLFLLGDLHGHVSFTSIAAAGMFLALVAGLITGLFRMSRVWDDDTHA